MTEVGDSGSAVSSDMQLLRANDGQKKLISGVPRRVRQLEVVYVP